jgi:hypothetical protein
VSHGDVRRWHGVSRTRPTSISWGLIGPDTDARRRYNRWHSGMVRSRSRPTGKWRLMSSRRAEISGARGSDLSGATRHYSKEFLQKPTKSDGPGRYNRGIWGSPGPPALPIKKRPACCLELIRKCPAPTNEIVTRSDLSQACSGLMCLAARIDHLPL